VNIDGSRRAWLATGAKPASARAANRLRHHVQLYFNDIAMRRIWVGSLGHTHEWQFDEVQLLQLFRDAALPR
jgi:hypothetical protein